jgi:hypothetical protein
MNSQETACGRCRKRSYKWVKHFCFGRKRFYSGGFKMRELKSKILFVCVFVLLFGAAPVALGDWDVGDGHKMHYPQLPKPGGWDVALWSEGSVWLADDWQCSETGPVKDIHFWLSWEQNVVWPIGGFTVRIWSDDPCGPNGYSEPNDLLWERDFDAGQFTVRDMPDDLQGWFDPYSGSVSPDDHIMWQQINIEDIIDPWIQKEGKIYWLMIDMWGAPDCGWKESGSPHFRDNGVYWDGLKWNELIDPEIYESMDLAFVITGEVKNKNLKWSQPPIEWDPCLATPIYCGWDEVSYMSRISTPVYQNWDANAWGYYVPGAMVLMGDDMTLAGTSRKLDHYDFAINSSVGTAPYTVTSELYTEVIDPGSGLPIPGAPIPGTSCTHNVLADGYVVLDCAPGTGAILPDNLWLVLTFDTDNAGWQIGEQAELGSTSDVFALDDGTGWSLYWYGGDPQASFEANIWCEGEQWTIAADDFRCLGSMPATSVHWWGSHLGWEEPGSMPLDLPIAWRIGFWSNVAADPTADPNYSYPEKLLWQIEVPADRVDVKEVGIDEYPELPFHDICYQYYVDLRPEEYFGQDRDKTEDNIYWLSIAAIYDPCVEDPQFLWGWKTRPWSWMDDGVRFWLDENPEPGMVLDPGRNLIEPIKDFLYDESFDLAFELDTDPNYIKWEQPFTGIRDWPHYEDELSMAMRDTRSKWWQGPDPEGWDVAFEYMGGPRLELADDWQCDESGTIDDIHFWLSWEMDEVGDINAVTVKIYSNDPCGPGGFSEPNELKWSRTFSRNQFSWKWYDSGDQGWFDPYSDDWDYPDHAEYYYLSIDYINDPFIQQKGDIYWLSIELEPNDASMGYAGWKTTTSPWQDVAVWRAPGAPWKMLEEPIMGQPLDLAFELTTSEPYINRLVADDWPCEHNEPVTAAVWWGSYIGYEYAACAGPQPTPPVKPDYFLLNIWTDVPSAGCTSGNCCYAHPWPGCDDPICEASVCSYDSFCCNFEWDSTCASEAQTDAMCDCSGNPFSYPNEIIWEYKAYDYDEVLVGYDKDPRDIYGPPREPVFRYSVRIPREDWFYQKEPNNVYWFSVVAVYDENEPDYDWGWTNHQHVYNDDAVEGSLEELELNMWSWAPLYDQNNVSADMSFILFTEPECFPFWYSTYSDWVAYGKPLCWCNSAQGGTGDYQCDGDTNLDEQGVFVKYRVYTNDLGVIVNNWMKQMGDPSLNPCADIDHKSQGVFVKYRVYTNDLGILVNNWMKQSSQLPGNCPRPE